MQRIDDKTYKKYFSQRRENSRWSEKNKTLVKKLEQQGLMTDFGREKVAQARKNGQWDAPKAPDVTEEQTAQYTRAYFDAKTDAGRDKRLSRMVDRLNKNLKPM